MRLTKRQLKRIIKEELLIEQVAEEDIIHSSGDLHDVLMNMEAAYDAWQYEGIRKLADFKKHLSTTIAFARAGGVTMKDINKVISDVWRTEKQARRPVKHSWSAWD